MIRGKWNAWIRIGVGLVMGTCAFGAAVSAQTTNGANARVQQNREEDEGFRIAGTVVNAVTGAVVARAKVSIADTRVPMQKMEMVTGENGHFEFRDIPAGKYALEGARSGYITAGYQQHEQYSTAIVTGPQFATDQLVLRLMPMGMISGHVLDEAGDPVRSASVRLFVEDHSEGFSRVTATGGASSDDRGYFDIGVLRPGTYYVSVNAKPWYAVSRGGAGAAGMDGGGIPATLDVAYPTTYFGGSTEAESAAPIELKGGEHRDIDIRLAPVPALHLVFRLPTDQAGQSGRLRLPMLVKQAFDSMEALPTGGFQQMRPGELDVTGVPAGRYEMIVVSQDPNQPTEMSEVDLERDGQELSSTPGEMMGKLKVTVKTFGEEPPPRQFTMALRDAKQKNVAFQMGDASGQASFEMVRPGKYELVIGAPGRQFAVTRTIAASGGSVAGHDITIAPGATLELTAELAEGEVGIEGVATKNGKPVAGVMVALVPNQPEAHVELFRRDQSDFDGTFALRGVIPGNYTIVAVEDAWGFDWQKPQALARYVQHGQNVIVGEKMRGMVHLPEAVEVQAK